MKLSPIELEILEKCCKQYDVDSKVLRALLSAEHDVYYSNESQKPTVVPEMVKIIEFWSIRSSKESSE